jgi:hypothetical protein
MGIKYTSQTASTYADDTPPDDGSQTEGNRVSINLLRTNYTDPIKDLADAINTQIVDYFSAPTRTSTGATSSTATDHGTLLQANGTFTVTLLAAATGGAGYRITVKNVGSGTITVAPQTGETIDGVTNGTLTLAPNESAEFMVIHEETGYAITNSHQLSLEATDIVANTITASGTVGIGGTLTVAGATSLQGLTATDIVANTVTASGNVGIGGTLTVVGTTTVSTLDADTITASGNVVVGGSITAGSIVTPTLVVNTVTASGSIVSGTLTIAAGSITDSSGAIDFGNEDLGTDGKVDYNRFEEDVYAIGSVATATTISFSDGSTQTLTLTGNATLTFAGEPTSGQFGSILLIVTVSGGAFSPTLAYGGGTGKTPFGDAIAWTGTNGAIDIVTIFTIDGGTTFYVSPFIMNAS